ncbi:MAG: hypothetical protein H0V33_02425 [Acidimicrobiia bacterium]|jgi:uncharacterized protein (DUF433 family)|nr:hypothetical protein [Acidimicrobiia bacterium]
MAENRASVQRSFRLSRATSDLLDAAAESTGESRNALADRLLGEAVRADRHPLVRFHTGAAGRREPLLVGTRLLVRQVIATVRDHGGDVDASATYLHIRARVVRAAVAYYAEFTDEIDAATRWAGRIEAGERARWVREQAALA